MKSHRTDFSTGSVYRNIIEIAIPMTVAQVLSLMYNIVDRIFLGRIPGEGANALTGVGLCFPVITLIGAFTLLYGNGGGPLCAIELGRKNRDEAGKIMGNSFVLLLITGFVLMVLSLIFNRQILYLFGASDLTYPYARDYLMIYLLGTVFVMVSLGMNPFINAQGFGNTGMLTILIGAVTNMVLDPVFIFTFGLGVKGAAIATVISQFLSFAWVIHFLTRRADVKLKRSLIAIDRKRTARITGLGLAGFMMQFTNGLVQVACNMTLSTFGGDIYVGVMTILNSVRDVFTLPIIGLTNGASPVMSFNYGEKAYEKVIRAIFFITAVCGVFTLIVWGLIEVAPDFFVKIFTSDRNIIEYSRHALHLYFFGFVFMTLQFSAQSTFTALGKSKRAVFFSIFRKVIIVVPLTFILPHFISPAVDGVFIAEPVSNLLGGLASYVTMMLTVYPELKRGAAGKAS